MPIINIKIIVETEKETEVYKHFLNHQNFDVYSIKEDEKMFAMVTKKINKHVNKSPVLTDN